MSAQVFEMPASGDRILIVRPCWLNLILSGAKTMEICGSPLRSGKYYLGYKKQIFAMAQMGRPLRITSEEHWAALRLRHRVVSKSLPYKRTYGMPILSVRALSPISFQHPRGAISIVKFRP